MAYDKLSGLPGFNTLLRNKLLELIRNYAKNRQYFSNTTYAIIEKLIQEKKIGIFFTPSLRTTKFFTTNNPINVVGGYNFNKHNIEVIVKWSFGIDAPIEMMKPQLHIVCKRIFALILSEALLLHDYKTNGSLSSRETIQKWYFTYFRGILSDSLNRFQLADKLATEISKDYGPRMFKAVEKPLIEGRSPSVIIKKSGNNEDLDIEGIPSVVKGSKQLRDIFVDAIEDFAVKKREKFYIDNYAYNDIKTFTDEFGEFGEFLYNNRDINLLPTRISEVPTDPTIPFEKRANHNMKTRLAELDREADKEVERNYDKYLEDHPEFKKGIEEAKRQRSLDRSSGSKESLELVKSSQNELKALTDIQTKALTAFGDNPEKTYIAAEFLDNNYKPTLDELADIPKGLKALSDKVEDLHNKLISGLNNGMPRSKPEDFKSLMNTYSTMSNYLNSAYNDARICINGKLNDQSRALPEVSNSSITPDFIKNQCDVIDAIIVDEKKIDEKNKYNKNIADPNDIFNSRTSNRVNAEFLQLADKINNYSVLEQSANSSNKINFEKERNEAYNQLDSLVKKYIKEDSDLMKLAKMEQNERNNILNKEKIIHSANTLNNTLKLEPIKMAIELEQNKEKIINDNFKSHTNENSIPDNDLNNIFNNISKAYIFDKNVIDTNNITNILSPEELVKNKNRLSSPILYNVSFGNLINNRNIFDINRLNNLCDVDIKNTKGIAEYNKLISDPDPTKAKLKEERRKTKIKILQNIRKKDNPKDEFGKLGSAHNNITNRVYDAAKDTLADASFIRQHNREISPIEIYRKSKEFIDNYINNPNMQQNKSIYNLTTIYKMNQLKGQLIDNPKTAEEQKNNLEIYKALLDIQRQNNPEYTATILHAYEIDPEKSKMKQLENKIEAQKKAYRRQLYLEGYDWMYSHLPNWNDVKRYAKFTAKLSVETAKAIKGIYKLAKIIYPSKSNIEMYANQPMGFEVMGDKKYFDLAYKLNCGIKKMYELNKGTVRRDMVYNEIYMPVSIFQKMLFAQINTQNEYSPEILFLIDCANKGLELMI